MWKGLFEQFIRKVFAPSAEDKIAMKAEMLALKEKLNAFELEDPAVLPVISEMTVIHTRFEEWKEQVPLLERAVTIRELLLTQDPTFDEDHGDYVSQLMHYAFILEELGRSDRASEVRIRARELRQDNDNGT